MLHSSAMCVCINPLYEVNQPHIALRQAVSALCAFVFVLISTASTSRYLPAVYTISTKPADQLLADAEGFSGSAELTFDAAGPDLSLASSCIRCMKSLLME